MVEQLINLVSNLSAGWQVFFLSMIPLTELRVAIPIGIAMGMDAWSCFLYAVLGNFVPIIPCLLMLNPLYKMFYKIKALRPFMDKYLERLRKKGRQTEKYGAIGLTLFVAVPLPLTGIWSGCVLAFLLGINYFYAVCAITLGEILAGIAVLFASLGIKEMAGALYGMEILCIIALVALIIWWFYKKHQKNKL